MAWIRVVRKGSWKERAAGKSEIEKFRYVGKYQAKLKKFTVVGKIRCSWNDVAEVRD